MRRIEYPVVVEEKKFGRCAVAAAAAQGSIAESKFAVGVLTDVYTTKVQLGMIT